MRFTSFTSGFCHGSIELFCANSRDGNRNDAIDRQMLFTFILGIINFRLTLQSNALSDERGCLGCAKMGDLIVQTDEMDDFCTYVIPFLDENDIRTQEFYYLCHRKK